MSYTKIAHYNEIHNESIERIKMHCNDEKIGTLCTWLMTTELNPYSYFTEDWAERTSTATGMSALMDSIHHALYDDGDISFVTVNGQPKIIFLNPNDFDFFRRVLYTLFNRATERVREVVW